MASMKEIALAASIIPENVSIMLTGVHGCGKTEWVENWLGKNVWGLERVVTWHPAHASDTGDVTGLPDKITTAEGEIVTKFCPPDWMMQHEPVLLLIDEANRGLSLVQNAIMQLTCSGTYGNIRLPKGSRIVACINPDDDGEYDVSQMDLAQKDRFVWFKFEPTVKETLNYFAEKHLNQRVISYLSDHPSMLDFDHFKNKELLEAAKNTGIGRTPSCRGWERVAHIVDTAEQRGFLEDENKKKVLLIAIEGIVGTQNAINLNEYLKADKVLSPEMLLLAENFEDTWISTLKKMDIPTSNNFFSNITIWMKAYQGEFTKNMADNFYKILETLRKDVLQNIIQNEILPESKSAGNPFVKLFKLNKDIKTLMINNIKLANIG